MLTFGPLAFAAPWILTALAALPLIWWLLRVTPPAPRRIAFPAVRLLFGLRPSEETPARTPWWLLLLRLFLATLIIVALAQPLINPGARLVGDGPLLLVTDDGWAAAANWPARTRALADMIDQAERGNRPVAVLTTAPPADGSPLAVSGLMPAAAARRLIDGLEPKPWPVDRAGAVRALKDGDLPLPIESVWLSDGVSAEDRTGEADELARLLIRFGPAAVVREPDADLARLLAPPETAGSILVLEVQAPAAPAGEGEIRVRAVTESGQVIAVAPVAFAAGARTGSAQFDLPAEARNQIVRLELDGESTAGAVVLLDERWRRRPVGLVSGGALEYAQPLLSDTYYLGRALDPTAEIHAGALANLMELGLTVLILADVGQVVVPDRTQLDRWLDGGGILVRFAGPKLAESDGSLLPVPLRSGTRGLGGALTWTTPARLGAFAEDGPFFGLAIPDDVRVSRQVLAEPNLDLSDRTWARLADGTPLVTAEPRGKGWLVLFHVTATPQWSNLPLSGLFVEMLQRVVALSQGISGERSAVPLPPLSLLDGFGRLGAPGAGAEPARPEIFEDSAVGPGHAPGFYGSNEARRALNLSAGITPPVAIGDLTAALRQDSYGQSAEIDLLPWMLVAALIVLVIDTLAGLALGGQLRRVAAVTSVFAVSAVLLAFAPRPADAQAGAQGDDSFALAATLETRLAYVVTGNSALDEMSRAGLTGLSQILTVRTAIEPAAPMAVNIESDELAFFALLYWPIEPDQRDMSPEALAKIDTFMKSGGTIVFDTRDQQYAETSPNSFRRTTSVNGPGAQRLQGILAGLDIPPLAPVPDDHVLTKTFYLLRDFPGRWSGGTVWVERHAGGSNDGVSSIIIGSNDWASAWAIDGSGRALAAVVPGGAAQREMAFRFGINLVMYAFTGNYKADQVHIPAILERLGQ